MKSIKQLKVSLSLRDEEVEVGELAYNDRNIYFKYYPSFIGRGIQISPFKLPLSDEFLLMDTPIFEGLFGVFDDSLPDGWGRLLLDRALIQRGISLHEVTPLDRLSFVGRKGMGALSYEPIADSGYAFKTQIELDDIALESHKILEGNSSDVIEELLALGGSSGGARPKILLGYHPEKDHLIQKKEVLPEGYEHWIIKFSSSTDPHDMAQIEYAYSKMALKSGLEMSDCQLFRGASGKLYFGTKRFDRIGNRRIHTHSAAGLMHDNFRLSNLDYGHIMDAAFRLENQVESYAKILRLAAFNLFTHNRDDHSKNFSFLMDEEGHWQFAPAYDLTFSFSAHGFHSTTIAGEGRHPSSQHLLELAHTFGVNNARATIKQVKDATASWPRYAKEAGVSKASSQRIEKVMRGLRK